MHTMNAANLTHEIDSPHTIALQFVCASEEARTQLCELLRDDFGMAPYVLDVVASAAAPAP